MQDVLVLAGNITASRADLPPPIEIEIKYRNSEVRLTYAETDGVNHLGNKRECCWNIESLRVSLQRWLDEYLSME
jgi:hypothetical protein